MPTVLKQAGKIMHGSVKAFVYKSKDHYVAPSLTVAVVTQGKTLDQTIANLREVAAQQLGGHDRAGTH